MSPLGTARLVEPMALTGLLPQTALLGHIPCGLKVMGVFVCYHLLANEDIQLPLQI